MGNFAAGLGPTVYALVRQRYGSYDPFFKVVVFMGIFFSAALLYSSASECHRESLRPISLVTRAGWMGQMKRRIQM